MSSQIFWADFCFLFVFFDFTVTFRLSWLFHQAREKCLEKRQDCGSGTDCNSNVLELFLILFKLTTQCSEMWKYIYGVITIYYYKSINCNCPLNGHLHILSQTFCVWITYLDKGNPMPSINVNASEHRNLYSVSHRCYMAERATLFSLMPPLQLHW